MIPNKIFGRPFRSNYQRRRNRKYHDHRKFLSQKHKIHDGLK